ncbi:hypothetical protein GCM10020369_18620 [Cryptosporangium minutisporangium]|uniref:Uncharacterized protein n=1 Tax=Cryptosporangium minutisporangium TaxID=113569 RepID=A0ABP6STV3_9ACTN
MQRVDEPDRERCRLHRETAGDDARPAGRGHLPRAVVTGRADLPRAVVTGRAVVAPGVPVRHGTTR